MINKEKCIITNKTKFFLTIILGFLKKFSIGIKLNPNQLFVYIFSNKLIYVINFFKFNSIIKAANLVDIIVIDNLIGKIRFEFTYVFWNVIYEFRLGIKLFNNGNFAVYSICNFYKSSVWLEREIWDMFGIKFLFNMDLRRILCDYGFKGHPLRKDFPLLGYCDVFYDDSIQSIKVSPIELAQSFRLFKFENPWYKWYLY